MSGMDVTIETLEETLGGGAIIFSKDSLDDANNVSDTSIELTTTDLNSPTEPIRTPPDSTKVKNLEDTILPSVSNTCIQKHWESNQDFPF